MARPSPARLDDWRGIGITSDVSTIAHVNFPWALCPRPRAAWPSQRGLSTQMIGPRSGAGSGSETAPVDVKRFRLPARSPRCWQWMKKRLRSDGWTRNPKPRTLPSSLKSGEQQGDAVLSLGGKLGRVRAPRLAIAERGNGSVKAVDDGQAGYAIESRTLSPVAWGTARSPVCLPEQTMEKVSIGRRIILQSADVESGLLSPIRRAPTGRSV